MVFNICFSKYCYFYLIYLCLHNNVVFIYFYIYLHRRHAFTWLPIYFTSDLVHGSWWYVIGSAFSILICLIVLLNDYELLSIGNDDSILPADAYRLAWGLLLASSEHTHTIHTYICTYIYIQTYILSLCSTYIQLSHLCICIYTYNIHVCPSPLGLFFTIGSIAFVRVTNEPPLQPIPSCSCLTSDELFGTWFFFMAVFPAVPYCFIYLAVSRSILYFICLIIAISLTIILFIFIKINYSGNEVLYTTKLHQYSNMFYVCLMYGI